ncbi:efflux RND transporter periplasmic adaptor subunit [Chitinimonas koreensis]|uniref:efflux RND transporter periplasmic adaptor subunit n=1 Tax=Chitinimonas koreensis TaxID=356302 RepID=UPI0006853FE9|nr:efflux RND transporter periplasmic adaptor subunit [Chitinimonas koreensis]QNM97339.1 efflux RND transporter periplasmic adaptor subunit [Chitinimonas koreensis]
MSRRIAFWLVGAGVVALVAYAALKPAGGQAAAGQGDRPQLVVTALSRAQDVPLQLEAQGTVTALNSVELRPQVASTVRQVHIREGQEVRAGQPLFTLDDRADSARVAQGGAELAQTRAQLADAERNLARSKALQAQGFVSQSAVDTAQSNYDALKAGLAAKGAELAGARVSQGYQRIAAPFAGRVGAIDVHPGSLVQPGMTAPLLTLTQLDPIGVGFTLPEAELNRLLANQAAGPVAARVQLADGRTLEGKLTFIDNAVDSASGSIRLKAEFANPDRKLWPGAFTRISIDLGTEKQAVVLPVGAVQTGPEGQFVYLVDAGQAVRPQPVKLARIVTVEGSQYAVVTGLPAGQRVVAEGGQNLRPGSKVHEGKPGGKAADKPAG